MQLKKVTRVFLQLSRCSYHKSTNYIMQLIQAHAAAADATAYLFPLSSMTHQWIALRGYRNVCRLGCLRHPVIF